MISSDTSLQPTVARDEARTLFGQTMGLVAVTSALFAVGAYLGRDMTSRWGALVIAAIGVLLGLNVAIPAHSSPSAMFGFGVLIGLGTAPVIAYYGRRAAVGLARAERRRSSSRPAARYANAATSPNGAAVLLGAARADRLRDRHHLRTDPNGSDLRDLGLVIFAISRWSTSSGCGGRRTSEPPAGRRSSDILNVFSSSCRSSTAAPRRLAACPDIRPPGGAKVAG